MTNNERKAVSELLHEEMERLERKIEGITESIKNMRATRKLLDEPVLLDVITDDISEAKERRKAYRSMYNDLLTQMAELWS